MIHGVAGLLATKQALAAHGFRLCEWCGCCAWSALPKLLGPHDRSFRVAEASRGLREEMRRSVPVSVFRKPWHDFEELHSFSEVEGAGCKTPLCRIGAWGQETSRDPALQWTLPCGFPEVIRVLKARTADEHGGRELGVDPPGFGLRARNRGMDGSRTLWAVQRQSSILTLGYARNRVPL